MSSTRYLEINALQSPISIGNDQPGRAMLSFNVLCHHSGSPGTFEEDIRKIIQDAGLGSPAVLNMTNNTWTGNIFIGSNVKLPEGAGAIGPYISIVAYGGLSPDQTHDGQKISKPTAQIITRAISYIVARDKANAIHAAVSGRHNLTITQ
jgi:hypothetical protein